MLENFYSMHMFLVHLYCQPKLVMNPGEDYRSCLFVMCMITALLFL